MAEQVWPDCLWLVRHGESAGNVARREAEAAGHALISLATRDVDIPLSELGREQAAALGRWYGERGPQEQPTVVLHSPYVRARETTQLLLDAAGLSLDQLECVSDERLREREFGILDRLTPAGVSLKYPEQSELRAALGKFYHRPPGGESWCDVILRLRSVVDTLSREYCRDRVLVVAHQTVLLCFRYLLEHLSEAEILAIDQQHSVANCSVTTYRYQEPEAKQGQGRGRLVLEAFNWVAPLRESGAPVTREPDVPIAPK